MSARTSAAASKDSPAPARDSAARSGVTRSVSAEPDNQQLQSLYASGALRAELMVGAADDPAEAEADHLASAVMSGSSSCACAPGAPPCPSCAAKAGTVHRKAKYGAARNGRAGTLSLGNERGLSAAERAFYEPRFNADFGGIRIHDNPQAAASAAHLGARAFSVDDQIAFGAGEYQSHTPEGRTLLAHELAHVALGHSGVRRQEGGMCSPDAPVCEPPAPAGESSITDPAVVAHDDGFDPCAVDVGKLTNYELLAEYANALRKVRAGRDAAGYFDYRNLQRRLIEERDRRVDMGHAWLATMPLALPDPVYQIVDGASGTFSVQAVPPGLIMGKPERTAAPYMTWDQFQKFLETHSIERVDGDTYRMRIHAADPRGSAMFGTNLALGGLYNAPGDLPLLLGGRGTAPGAPVAWPALPEVFYGPEWYRNSPAYMRADALQNPPAMDPETAARLRNMLLGYRRAPGVPPRVDPIGSTTPVEGGTAAVAVTDIPNLNRPAFPGASAAALPEGMRGTPGTSGGSVLTAANPTAVNHAEHVALENLRAAIDRALALGEISRADLHGRTVYLMVEQEPCSSCASGSGEGTAGVLEQFARRYPELTVEVRNIRTSRAYLYRGGVLLNPGGEPPALPGEIPAAPPGSVESIMTPEFARTLRYGGGAGGELRAMGVSGAQGAGLSAFVAMATSAGMMAFDTRSHPEWATELGVSGGLGAGGGFVGSATEQLIISRGTSAILSDITATGASRLTPGLVTGAGRLGGGAVGAMFVEGISIGLLEEREHSGAEVGVRLTRSAGLGAASVWAGAGIGAAAGSVVPVAGTAVGFIVGLLAGAAIYYVGDKIIPGGREDWDRYEAGCSHGPPPSAPTSSTHTGFDSPMFRCFDAATPIAMADGSFVPIGEIVAGDVVASYNERDGAVESRPVTAVHAAEPAMLIRFACSGAHTFTVTPLHKVATTHGWRAAGELAPGDELRCLGESNALATMEIESIEILPPRGLVFDLSVEVTHTYFAGGVLAHNKLP